MVELEPRTQRSWPVFLYAAHDGLTKPNELVFRGDREDGSDNVERLCINLRR